MNYVWVKSYSQNAFWKFWKTYELPLVTSLFQKTKSAPRRFEPTRGVSFECGSSEKLSGMVGFSRRAIVFEILSERANDSKRYLPKVNFFKLTFRHCKTSSSPCIQVGRRFGAVKKLIQNMTDLWVLRLPLNGELTSLPLFFWSLFYRDL